MRELAATLPGRGQFESFDDPPALPSELVPVWVSWGPESQVGPTTEVEVSGGGLTRVTLCLRDHRTRLYPARVAWLTENGYTDSEDRAAMLWLWQQLDLEDLRLQGERVRARQKELDDDAKRKG